MFTPLRRIPRTPMEKPNPHIHELETELAVLRSHSKYYNVGPPGVLGIWGERLFIFRDLGSTCNYFRGAGEQARSFGDIGSPAKMQKIIKEKPPFSLIFLKISSAYGGKAVPDPPPKL